MSSADTPHALQPSYLNAGTQTEDSPLPRCSSDSSRRLGSTGCTCACSCQAGQPLPATPTPVLTAPKKERKPTPVSDRSLLGRHPSRFSRVTNRVVSLPELAEENALGEKPSVQPRVASMPDTFPPFFPTGMDEDSSLDAIPSHALSGTVFTMQHDPRISGYPQTPSPPMHRHDPGVLAFSDSRAPYGEEQYSQDWNFWASSPPKPIPALHGPLSLPYARCPSGAEGTLIESDNRVSNVIWGLDNIQARTQPQADDSPLTEESPALSEFSPDPNPDPLLHAAFRLSQQMDGLSMAPPGTSLLSPIGDSIYLAGLGLDITAKRQLEAERGTAGMRRPSLQSLYPQTADSRRVVSAGSLAVGAGGRPKRPVSTNNEVPTPPLPQWTPRFPGLLSLPDSRGYHEFVQRDSARLPTPDRHPSTQVRKSRPNSTVPQLSQMEYSSGIDTNRGPRFDFYDHPLHEHLLAVHSTRLEYSRRHAVDLQEKLEAAPRSEGAGLASYVTTQRDPSTHTLHSRLPVLEEDASFAASSKHATQPSQAPHVTRRRQGSTAPSRKDELYEMNSRSETAARSTVGPRTHCATPMPTTRTIKTAIYAAPHRRAKERKE